MKTTLLEQTGWDERPSQMGAAKKTPYDPNGIKMPETPPFSSGSESKSACEPPQPKNVFACPRDFLGNRFVYLVMSSRARGLSVGINMNPDKRCNFDCIYCEVDRSATGANPVLDVPVMTEELKKTLEYIYSGKIRENPRYNDMPVELLELRDVALSGDGEPTLSENFFEAMEAVIHLRAQRLFPFFKVVLITNSSGLDLPQAQEALKFFTTRDEVWCKLDAGTQALMDRINHPRVPLEKVLSNILLVGQRRPVVIQTLFPTIDGQGPSFADIADYIARLKELKDKGALISLVQIYSATRPMVHPACGRLPLKNLSAIARNIRQAAGIKAEVF